MFLAGHQDGRYWEVEQVLRAIDRENFDKFTLDMFVVSLITDEWVGTIGCSVETDVKHSDHTSSWLNSSGERTRMVASNGSTSLSPLDESVT
jgi:hypothetical protein